MKRLATLTITVGLFAGLIACNTSDPVTSPDFANDEPYGAWALQTFELSDGTIVRVPDPSSYTLDLGHSDAGRAHVRADCNVCNGSFELSGSTIELGPMACTLAACPPGSLGPDYQRALSSTTAFQRSGGSLTLRYDGGLMRFEER